MRAAFDAYTKAALARDGATASSLVASPVLEFYDQARDAALTGTAAQVRRLPVSQQLTVYSMRGELDPAVLRRSSPEELVEAAVDKGLVGEQGIRNLELGDVDVDGDRASAEVAAGGRTAPFRFMFLREGGQWKIDLLPLLKIATTPSRLRPSSGASALTSW